MSDFGANIFDDPAGPRDRRNRPAPPAGEQEREPAREPAAEPARTPPAPVHRPADAGDVRNERREHERRSRPERGHGDEAERHERPEQRGHAPREPREPRAGDRFEPRGGERDAGERPERHERQERSGRDRFGRDRFGGEPRRDRGEAREPAGREHAGREHGGREPMGREGHARPPHGEPRDRGPAPAERPFRGGAERDADAGAGQRAPRPRGADTITLLVDLTSLQSDARAQGGELAVHRLRAGLAGQRTVEQATCFAPRGTTPPSGFDVIAAQDSFAGGMEFAAAAFGLAARAATLVLAPPTPAVRQLATALRARGHRVELAGFVATNDEGQTVKRLGRDCLFVP